MKKQTIDSLVGPKRKFALLFGYNGLAYQGLQVNPGVKTIEQELHTALGKLTLISDKNLDELQKIGWSRAARTDKRVHAIGQVVSMKLCLLEDKTSEFLPILNSTLPADIQVFDILRVGNSFNSKFQCFGRIYKYYLPSFMLDNIEPNEILGYRIPNERLKKLRVCLGKYVGTKNYHNFTKNIAHNDPARKRFISSITAETFDYSHDRNHEELELVEVTIDGQSFLLNQIRHLIGLAIEVVRRNLDPDIIEKALESNENEKVILPMAPGEGLLLDQCLFPKYNQRLCCSYDASDKYIDTLRSDIRRPIQFVKGQIVNRRNDFFRKEILGDIIKAETLEKVFSSWKQHQIDLGIDDSEFPKTVQRNNESEFADYEKYKDKKKIDKDEHKLKKSTNRNAELDLLTKPGDSSSSKDNAGSEEDNDHPDDSGSTYGDDVAPPSKKIKQSPEG